MGLLHTVMFLNMDQIKVSCTNNRIYLFIRQSVLHELCIQDTYQVFDNTLCIIIEMVLYNNTQNYINSLISIDVFQLKNYLY